MKLGEVSRFCLRCGDELEGPSCPKHPRAQVTEKVITSEDIFAFELIEEILEEERAAKATGARP